MGLACTAVHAIMYSHPNPMAILILVATETPLHIQPHHKNDDALARYPWGQWRSFNGESGAGSGASQLMGDISRSDSELDFVIFVGDSGTFVFASMPSLT